MKISLRNPIVELDGDEMTRVIWRMIKDKLVLPYLDIDLKYYDLGIENRDATDDRVTTEAAEAIGVHGVGVKCATITPNAARVREYGLKREWKSPNGTLRSVLDGTVFRKPIIVRNVPPMVRSWNKPITIGRHAYGDIYKNVELAIPGGVVQTIHNMDASIRSFAATCMRYALEERQDLWFATKDTISKTYHARFRDIFQEEYERNADAFAQAGIAYFYTLIDDAVARVMRAEGGFLWACMNYDGDVMSDMLASGFGSLGLMTSVLVSPAGAYEFEAAHGTVQRHYYRHQKGEETSTNSTASIFAWTGAIRKRGELDGVPEAVAFADRLERAVVGTIESGTMTGDLARIADGPATKVSTEAFIDAVAKRLEDG